MAESWEEWEKMYPVKKGKVKPSDSQLLVVDSFSTRREAEKFKDWDETDNERSGLEVIEFEDKFFVVFGPRYYGGYKD